MWPGPPLYEAAWGAAGLAFGLGGARILAGTARRAGRRPGVSLRAAPLVAVLLALAGARAHALLDAPAAFLEAPSVPLALRAAAAAGGLRIAGGLLVAAAFLLLFVPRTSGGALSGARALDALVPLAGGAIALGRLGCLAAGCCFGVPTELPWGLRYPAGSAAYWNHVARGLVADDGGASLAVHPLPLYLGVAALLAGGASLAAHRRASAAGGPTLVFVATMAGLRLAIEPLRETRFVGEVPGQRLLGVAVLAASLGALALRALAARRDGRRVSRDALRDTSRDWRRETSCDVRRDASRAGRDASHQPRPEDGTPRARVQSQRAAATSSPNGDGPSRPGTPRRWIRRAPSPSS